MQNCIRIVTNSISSCKHTKNLHCNNCNAHRSDYNTHNRNKHKYVGIYGRNCNLKPYLDIDCLFAKTLHLTCSSTWKDRSTIINNLNQHLMVHFLRILGRNQGATFLTPYCLFIVPFKSSAGVKENSKPFRMLRCFMLSWIIQTKNLSTYIEFHEEAIVCSQSNSSHWKFPAVDVLFAW